MGYGVTVPEGYLPAYSVDSEWEAHKLITLACEMNMRGEYIAKELAQEQTLENLDAFGERLHKAWIFLKHYDNEWNKGK